MNSVNLSKEQLISILSFLAEEQNQDLVSFTHMILSKIRERDKKLKYLANELSRLSLPDRRRLLKISSLSDKCAVTLGISGSNSETENFALKTLQPPVINNDLFISDKQNPSVAGNSRNTAKNVASGIFSQCPSVSPAAGKEIFESMQTADLKNRKISGIHNLSYFLNFTIPELTRTRPELLIINGESFKVGSWKELVLQFVRFLINRKDLGAEQLPLCPNLRSRKAFINSFPGQPTGTGRSGLFEKAQEHFYVDIKYNAKYHLLNIKNTLDYLGLTGKYDIKISMRQ